MALEAVIFPQDPFGYSSSSSKDLYNLAGGNWSYEEDQDFLGNQTETFPYNSYGDYWNYAMDPNFNELLLHQPNDIDPSFETATTREEPIQTDAAITAMQSGGARPRRRRSKSQKNKEEIENQRMTHITVERNRRKQMNEYLSSLRSLMPDSYVQRGDQASIIGGAINFVKELEQQVHFLSAQTDVKGNSNGGPNSFPFSHFFTFPQYSSTTSTPLPPSPPLPSLDPDTGNYSHQPHMAAAPMSNQIQSSVADIEVNMVDSHANLKIRAKKLPKQLLKLVSGLHSLHLSVLHLNVSSVDQIVLYSFSVKVEENCRLSSVDEMARALHQLLSRIQEEAFSI